MAFQVLLVPNFLVLLYHRPIVLITSQHLVELLGVRHEDDTDFLMPNLHNRSEDLLSGMGVALTCPGSDSDYSMFAIKKW